MSRKPSPERKNAILQASGELFDLKGYRGVSMDEICLRCRITKPTLYYYFPNKEALYIQCMLQILKGYKELIHTNRPVMERIEQLSALMMDRLTHNIDKMMRDMETIQDNAHRQQIHQVFYQELFDPIVSLFSEGIEQGLLREGDPEFFAWAYLGLVNTFVDRASAGLGSRQEIAQQLVALFVSGVKSPAG